MANILPCSAYYSTGFTHPYCRLLSKGLPVVWGSGKGCLWSLSWYWLASTLGRKVKMKPCENLLVLSLVLQTLKQMWWYLRKIKLNFRSCHCHWKKKCKQEIGFPWVQTYLNIQYRKHLISITSPNQRAAVGE